MVKDTRRKRISLVDAVFFISLLFVISCCSSPTSEPVLPDYPIYYESVKCDDKPIDESKCEIIASKVMSLPSRFEGLSGCYHQALAIYDNVAFVFYASGGCYLYDLANNTLIAYSSLSISSAINHANNVSLGNMRQKGDRFPLFYVTTLWNDAPCTVERFNEATGAFELRQIIRFDVERFSRDGMAPEVVIDNQNNLLYAFAFSDDKTHCHLLYFDIPSMNNTSVMLTDKDVKGEYDLALGTSRVMQSAIIVDGRFFLMCGGSTGSSDLYILDLITSDLKQLAFRKRINAEPEGIAVYNDFLYINTNFPAALWQFYRLR